VWDEISARLAALRMAWIFENKDVRDALTSLTRELAGPKAKSLGWTFKEDEDHIQRQFKSVSPCCSLFTSPSPPFSPPFSNTDPCSQCSGWLVSRTIKSNLPSLSMINVES
jgi:hypothetical protein